MPHPSGIKRRDVVAFLFPEVAKAARDGRLDQVIPGRSWPAWREPPAVTEKATDLDRWVTDLIERTASPMIRDRDALREIGVTCPYYAARYWSFIALQDAARDQEAHSAARAQRLKDQRDAYVTLATAARRTIEGEGKDRYHHGDAGPRGNPYWEDGARVWDERVAAREIGKAACDAATAALARAEEFIQRLTAEIDRIAPPTARPDIWKTSYATTMGNLYQLLTGEEVPDHGDIFGDLIKAPLDMIGTPIKPWGQVRTLRKRFSDPENGPGFGRGADGGMGLENLIRFRMRGPGAACIVHDALERADVMSVAMIRLADYTDAPVETVLRECLLKPYIRRHPALKEPEVLLIQLGWQEEPRPNAVQRALRETVARAKGGDIQAAAVIEILMTIGIDIDLTSRKFASGLSWLERYAGLAVADVMYGLYRESLRGDELSGALLGLIGQSDPVAGGLMGLIDLRIHTSTEPEDIELRGLIEARTERAEANIAHHRATAEAVRNYQKVPPRPAV